MGIEGLFVKDKQGVFLSGRLFLCVVDLPWPGGGCDGGGDCIARGDGSRRDRLERVGEHGLRHSI